MADYAICFSETGGPEVLKAVPIEQIPTPGPGEVVLRQYAVGVNFIDTYHRSGLYPLSMPSGIGVEGAGEIIACGPEVTHFSVGDRVAYCGGPLGAYADMRKMPADLLVLLPDRISYEAAASIMLRGLTACCWVTQVYPVSADDTILIHAAAGGVGTLLVQWAKLLGATVIGTCGTAEKAKLAEENGCDHVIIYTQEDFVARVQAITGGEGVDVVYDSVGKDTFFDSLKCLKFLGMMVSFGNATGAVPPISLLDVSARVPVYLIRPSVFQFLKTPEERQQYADELFGQILKGNIHPTIGEKYPLLQAAEAQRALAGRQTTGSIILTASDNRLKE